MIKSCDYVGTMGIDGTCPICGEPHLDAEFEVELFASMRHHGLLPLRFCWFIERTDTNRWLQIKWDFRYIFSFNGVKVGRKPCIIEAWTNDPLLAERFLTKGEAESHISAMVQNNLIATEHEFVPMLKSNEGGICI